MKENEPIWFDKKQELNKDTYQTVKTNTVVTEINLSSEPKYKIMVCTPCHSDVSMHYAQATLKFQQECLRNNILVSFTLLKSSLVTQGRNLCVSEFISHEHKYEHLLFIDSDIDFEYETIIKMIEADKDVIACPYPMKTINEDKMWTTLTEKYENIRNKSDVIKSSYMFPLKVKDKNCITVDNGIMEATHVPTGCMLIKRHVLEKMIKNHPELEIYQPTIINGEETKKDYFYNLFDTLHDPDTKRYYGEDFGFCQRWRDMGGQVFAYVSDYITHVGEHSYCARFLDELQSLKRIDDDEKIK
tara:strand:+ start:266 stop:1168 length:903 start_codon:yes stop_codon:yes gene_type:complete